VGPVRNDKILLGLIEGLTNLESAAPEELVPVIHSAMQEPLVGQEVALLGSAYMSFTDMVTRYVNLLHPRNPTGARIVHEILNSLETRVVLLKGASALNDVRKLLVLAKPGQVNMEEKETIRNVFNLIRIFNRKFGTGVPNRAWKCIKCRGCDHPSGLCPYPLSESWQGPPPTPRYDGRDADDNPNPTLISPVGGSLAGPSQTQAGRGQPRGFSRGGSGRGRAGSNIRGRGRGVPRGRR
jgi:hypothetical protein